MAIASPCTQHCKLSADGTHCATCGRTLAEIEAWARMGQAARDVVTEDLPRRRDQPS